MPLSPLRPALRASLRDDSRATPLAPLRWSPTHTAAAWIGRFISQTLLRGPVDSGLAAAVRVVDERDVGTGAAQPERHP